MSRYVDLNGMSWDGEPISSKIQEVQTKHGYMQGITVGWLWGDNVPHLDLEEHDKQIRAEVIEKIRRYINTHRYSNDDLIEFLEQLKDQK